MEGFKVIIAADASQGINAVAKFNAELSKTNAAGAGVSAAVTKVNTSLNSIRPASNTAGLALQNLGRIAQDAPFGFIGISNNINPLLESFQRLRAESGSTGLALKSLASGLLGGAGIGLAVSIISGLLVTFGDRLFKTKKTTDEAAESAKKFADAQRDSAEHLHTQLIEVESLVRIAQSDVSTKKEQANALLRLNEIIPDNIGHVTDLNIKTSEGISIIRQYTQALEDQATAEVLRGRAAELRVKLFDAERKHNDEVLKQKLILAPLLKSLEKGETAASSARARASESFAIRQAQFAEKIRDAQDIIAQSDKEFLKAQTEFNKELGALRAEIDKNTKGALDVTIPEVKTKPIKKVTIKVEEIELDPAKVGLIGTSFSKGFSGMAEVTDKVNTALATLGRPLEGAGATTITRFFDVALDRAEKLAGFVADTLGPAFASVFDTIVSGGGNALQAFGNALKQIISKLVAAAITAAIFAAIVSAFPGGAAFGKGFLNAFKVLSGLPFAEGGIVTRPMNAIIGERGPEAVIPLRDLNKVLGSIGGAGSREVFIAENRIDGNDIVTIYRRASNRYGGTFT